MGVRSDYRGAEVNRLLVFMLCFAAACGLVAVLTFSGCHTPQSRYPRPTSKPLAMKVQRSLFDLAWLGDMNCDGSVNFADISPFNLYLSDFAAWRATYPDCPPVNGDCNGDGVYPDVGDTNGFVSLLNGNPQAVLIKGRVTDASGAPIPGARIQMQESKP